MLWNLVRHPVRHFISRWNWKSAVLSSAVRSTLFFVVNLQGGLPAAQAAFLTELVFRACTAGFYGALTQAFRHVRPAWQGTLAAVVLLPLSTHTLELAVHYTRGTSRLAQSIAVSVVFTAFSTAFNLYAMRQGALVVGEGRASIWEDLRRTPRLIGEFASGILRGFTRFA